MVGVSSPFFFPLEVISFTTSEEFHSVRKTRRPRLVSHFSRRWSWVVFPDPSIPSPTMSRPLTGNL